MGKIGVKRSDRRFRSPDGAEYDSRFEWQVHSGLESSGYIVRRTDERDSIAYHTAVKKGRCVECGTTSVIQERIYTPDFFVAGSKGARAYGRGSYYLECKGYFPGDKRSLFRSVAKQATGVDLRILFAKEVVLRGTKLTNVEYIDRFCPNIPIGIWDRDHNEIIWVKE